MLAAPKSAYRGEQLHELTVKKALQHLCPSIHFDMGGCLDIWHPKINRWQGVFHAGRHVGSMGRGWLPEFNLYREEMIADGIRDGEMGRGELLEIGWRHTLEKLVRKQIPGVTWFALCQQLNVDYRRFEGDVSELNISEKEVEPIHGTLG